MSRTVFARACVLHGYRRRANGIGLGRFRRLGLGLGLGLRGLLGRKLGRQLGRQVRTRIVGRQNRRVNHDDAASRSVNRNRNGAQLFDLFLATGIGHKIRVQFGSAVLATTGHVEVGQAVGVNAVVTAGSGIEVGQPIGIHALRHGFALKAEVVDVVELQRQITQRRGKGADHVRGVEHDRIGRRQAKVGDHREFVGAVEHAHATVVHDHDFTHETVGFFHQGDLEVLAVRNVEANLGTANTDGGHGGVQGHRVRVGLCDVTRHEREHALHDRHGHGTFHGARVIDHFVQDHAALFGHGEGRFVGKDNADGAVGTGFKNVTLEHRVTDLQFDLGAVGTDHGNGAGKFFDLTDGLFGNARTGLGDHARGRRACQTRGKIAIDLGALRAHQVRLRINHEIIGDRDLATVGPGHDQIGAFVGEIGRCRIQALGQGQGIGRPCVNGERPAAFAAGTGSERKVIGRHDLYPLSQPGETTRPDRHLA